MSEQVQDKLISFTNVVRGKNKKDNDRFQLYISPEVAVELAELLVEKASGESRGVKLDLHFATRVVKASGKEFETAFMFVKEKQASPFGSSSSNTKSVETSVKTSKEEREAKIKAFKAKQLS